MAISNTAWNGAASNYATTEAYCAACLIDDNLPGKTKIQALCKLPVKTPSGDVNSNAVHAAAAALAGGRGGVKASPASKKKAAAALRRYYAQMKEDPPPSLKTM